MNGLEKGSLPDGWRWAQLGEVAKVFAGSAAPQGEDYFDPQGPRFVRVSDLGQKGRTSFLVNIRDRLSPKALRQCSLVLAKKGTVLFPKSGAAITTNNRALLGIDAYIVSHLMAVEPTEQTTSNWLYWSLCQLDMMDYSDNVGYPSLKRSTVEKVTIPLPPLSEQKRIAAILNEQMMAVERARAAAEAQWEAAKALPAAYLRAVFNSLEAQRWPRKKLGEVAKLERGKFTPRPRNDPRYYGGPYPWIQTGEVEDAKKYITSYRNTLNEQGLSVSKMFPKGTLVITIAATIGAVGILSFDSCMPDSLVAITPREGVSDSEYLYYLLMFVREHLESIAPQMAQANLKLGLLEPLEIPAPPLFEQQRIVAMLTEQIAAAEQTHGAVEEQLDTINKLPAALLRRAFSGEL